MMPWERPQQPQSQPRHRMPPEAYPPPSYPAQPVQPPQPAQPEIPVVARNSQTGEQVRLDIGAELREAIRQAVTQSVGESRQLIGAKINDTIAQRVHAEVQEEVKEEVDQQILEERFSAGATTTRTFLQNAAVDMGVAVMAVVTTISQPTFDLTDRAAWLVMGTSLVKTLVMTMITWGSRIEAK